MLSQAPCEIIIDLETIPSQRMDVQDYLRKNITPDARLKDPEKVAADMANKEAAALDKSGLEGWSNHIICIGVGINDHPAIDFYTENPIEKERDMIIRFFDYISQNCGKYAHTWIGHNLNRFDLKVLRQRCIVLGIKWPSIITAAFQDKWGDVTFDTMLKWCGDNRDSISLEKLCLALGVETPKDDLKGSEVYQAWKDGRNDQIREYCRRDVEATRAVYRKMTGGV